MLSSALILNQFIALSIQPFQAIGIGVTFSPNLRANIYKASRMALATHIVK